MHDCHELVDDNSVVKLGLRKHSKQVIEVFIGEVVDAEVFDPCDERFWRQKLIALLVEFSLEYFFGKNVSDGGQLALDDLLSDAQKHLLCRIDHLVFINFIVGQLLAFIFSRLIVLVLIRLLPVRLWIKTVFIFIIFVLRTVSIAIVLSLLAFYFLLMLLQFLDFVCELVGVFFVFIWIVLDLFDRVIAFLIFILLFASASRANSLALFFARV